MKPKKQRIYSIIALVLAALMVVGAATALLYALV